MDLWFTEHETDHLRVQHKVTRTLYHDRSQFQEVAVVDTVEYGRMLILDGVIQTSVRDEFVYHEMLAHVPLFLHPKPEKVLVIGGGDGGTVREVLRHPEVKRVHLVEIDERVVEVSQKYLPELAGKLTDPRVSIHFADGIQWVKEKRQVYDVILIDSSDPLGPAVGLFTTEFYGDAAKALKKDGLFAAQTESAFYTPQLVQDIHRAIGTHFQSVHFYTASVPTYSSWPWGFTLAAKRAIDPTAIKRRGKNMRTKYYSPEMHRAAFALPPFVKELLQEGSSTEEDASTA